MAIVTTASRFIVNGTNTQMPVSDLVTQNTSDLLNSPANTFVTSSDGLINLQNSASGVSSGVATATPPLALTGVPVSSSGNSAISGSQNALTKSIPSMPKSFKSLAGVAALTGVASVAGVQNISGLGNLITGRITKDSYSSNIQVAGGASGFLNTFISGLGSSSKLATFLKQIAPACQSIMLANFNTATMPVNVTSCGNGNTRVSSIAGCNLNQMAQLIAQAGGGAFAPSVINPSINNAALAALIGGGYKSGLCSVFKSMVSNVSALNDVASVASSVVGTSIAGGDVATILDVGASMKAGATLQSQMPAVAASTFSIYKNNKSTANASLAKAGTSLVAGVGGLLPNWNKSSDGTTLSSSNMGGPKASNAADVTSTIAATTTTTDPNAFMSVLLAAPTMDNAAALAVANSNHAAYINPASTSSFS